ncbi:MAG TPA: ABC transporter permease [Acidimicrobiales bacterium]|nr:ABC transporter permease [Acidimicrobiales bacterium]
MTDTRASVATAEAAHSSDAANVTPARVLDLTTRGELAAARGPKTTRVVAARVNLPQRLAELWRVRELFVFLVRKEIKVKYKNSFLGFLWSMLNPALTLSVFYVIFTFFLPNGIPSFVLYMFAAVLLWNLFQTSVITGTVAVTGNAGLVRKVAFPREIMALASVGAAVVFFVFQFLVLVLFLVGFRHPPDWPQLWLMPLALLAVMAFAATMAVFLSAVNVYLRDTQHLVEVVLFAWFWALPGIYAFSGPVHNKLSNHRLFAIPGTHLIWVYFADPLVAPVMTFQRLFYNVNHPISTIPPHKPIVDGVLAHYSTLWYASSDLIVFAVSIVLLMGAMIVFGRLEGNFAEEL